MADFTHDGIGDSLQIKWNQVTNPAEEAFTVLLMSGASSKILWGIAINTVHAGWAALYSYLENGREYLMVFKPAMYQGLANYEYRIFSVDESGTEHVLHANQIQFDVNYPKETDPALLRAFTKEINQYLSKAHLILSTLEGEVKTAAGFDWEKSLSFDSSETLREMEEALKK